MKGKYLLSSVKRTSVTKICKKIDYDITNSFYLLLSALLIYLLFIIVVFRNSYNNMTIILLN